MTNAPPGPLACDIKPDRPAGVPGAIPGWKARKTHARACSHIHLSTGLLGCGIAYISLPMTRTSAESTWMT